MMIHIPTALNRYGDGLESGTIHVTDIKSFPLCHIGIVPEGRSGRQVFQGPLVPGPWGFAVTHSMVIDNHGGLREAAQALKLKTGEPFTLDGLPGVWTFRAPDRYKLEGDGPKLQRVEQDS